ncbi:MAG: hypothetical protein KBT21_11300 [Treponema sp.]|nr:hypothetical protein [Candidatus Treponema merdequi]
METEQKLYEIGINLNLLFNNRTIFGSIKNTFVIGKYSGSSKYQYLSFDLFFPCKLNEEDKSKLLSMNDSGNGIDIYCNSSNENYDLQVSFLHPFFTPGIEVITKTITEITDYIYQKYPDLKIHCMTPDCTETENLQLIDEDSYPLLICPECCKKIKQSIIEAEEIEKNKPNNYKKGIRYAVLYCIPALIISFLIFHFTETAKVSGLFFTLFTYHGYSKSGAKYTKDGNFLIFITALFTNISGVFLLYIIQRASDFIFYYQRYINIISLIKDVIIDNTDFYITLGITSAIWLFVSMFYFALKASSDQYMESLKTKF